ncbi:GTP-binding protein [Streptomyces albireticuli]|uniref:GTP-binding protein n=1 Tax=Streptomyces albireticuli TaxID=1940 RepID=UPI0036B99D6C
MHTSRTLNLGILAHVDAGKTSLTERLLFDTGAIDRLGSVDAGSTRTDSGELERRRGITIRTAVAPFRLGDLGVNLIDTPGHSDFVAEVGRALGVLDGAVLVLSAVEGVQARTRVLMRTLRRLRLPTLVFVNKTDRPGAREAGTLADIRRRLAPRVVPMATVHGIGTPAARTVPGSYRDPAFRDLVAEALAEDDDALLARLVDGAPPGAGELRAALADRTARGLIHPVYFGSALSGEGVAALLDGIAAYLPAGEGPGAADAPPGGGPGRPRTAATGTVFAVERGTSGERTAYLRLFSGELAERARITLHRREADGTRTEHTGRITFLETVGAPPDTARRLTAGGIARIRGLAGIRVGDRLGSLADAGPPHFAPPSLESVVRPVRPADAARLHAALAVLADQDPLIGTRALPDGGTSVLLYGEVQKEVVAATLDEEFGVGAVFEPSTTILRERPAGTGEALEEIDRHGGHLFWATVGLRVEPGARGSGNVFRRDTELGALPLAFDRAVEETVHRTLDEGPHGRPVTDCVVTLTRSGFVGPVSTAADFRQLTPLVLARALADAGTRLYEPCHRYELDVPVDCLSAVTGALAAAGAVVGETVAGEEECVLRGVIPARGLAGFEGKLPGLARGEGVWWTTAGPDREVRAG